MTPRHRGAMPNTLCVNTMISASSASSKASLTFESVVCSQLELKRLADTFSRRRSTVCRRPSIHISVVSSPVSPNPHLTSMSTPPKTHLYEQTPLSISPDISTHFLSTKFINDESRLTPMLSTNCVTPGVLENMGDRQSSLSSVFLWDGGQRNDPIKPIGPRASKWSIDDPKETPQYGSLRSRLVEEYADCETLIEFIKKTILVLLKTRAATAFLGLLLILPVVMMCVGVSHLSDCPRQANLPIYLFVAGIVWTTKLLQNIWYKYRLQQKVLNDEEPSSDRNDGHAFIDGLLTSFLILWFFLGHYWLISIGYPPHFEQLLENPDIWCHKTVVLCSLASILITYFILICFISLVTFLVVFTRYTIIKQASTT